MSGPRDVTVDYVEARIGRAVRIERRSGLEDVHGRLVGLDDLARVEVDSLPSGTTTWVPLENVAALWVAG